MKFSTRDAEHPSWPTGRMSRMQMGSARRFCITCVGLGKIRVYAGARPAGSEGATLERTGRTASAAQSRTATTMQRTTLAMPVRYSSHPAKWPMPCLIRSTLQWLPKSATRLLRTELTAAARPSCARMHTGPRSTECIKLNRIAAPSDRQESATSSKSPWREGRLYG